MISLARRYARQMSARFGYLATWSPGSPLALGDVGFYEDNIFRQVTTLANLGIKFTPRLDATNDARECTSGNDLSVVIKVSGEILADSKLLEADVGIRVEFGSRNAFLFRGVSCLESSIDDKNAVHREVIARYEAGDWKKDWVMVDEVVECRSGRVIISQSNKALVEFKGKGGAALTGWELANLGASVEVANKIGSMFDTTATAGMTPLFRASRLRHTFLSPKVGVGAVRSFAPRPVRADNDPADFISFDPVEFTDEADDGENP